MSVGDVIGGSLMLLFAASGFYVIVCSLAASIGLVMPGRRSLFVWAVLCGLFNLWLTGSYLRMPFGTVFPSGTETDDFTWSVLCGGALVALIVGSVAGVGMRLARLRAARLKAPIAPLPSNL